MREQEEKEEEKRRVKCRDLGSTVAYKSRMPRGLLFPLPFPLFLCLSPLHFSLDLDYSL